MRLLTPAKDDSPMPRRSSSPKISPVKLNLSVSFEDESVLEEGSEPAATAPAVLRPSGPTSIWSAWLATDGEAADDGAATSEAAKAGGTEAAKAAEAAQAARAAEAAEAAKAEAAKAEAAKAEAAKAEAVKVEAAIGEASKSASAHGRGMYDLTGKTGSLRCVHVHMQMHMHIHVQAPIPKENAYDTP